MPEVPEWFPKTMEELYRLAPGQPRTIGDPRVATSHGGGAFPEQHWGILVDGRVFYFRYRHGHATLKLGPDWYEAHKLPARDKRITMEMWDEIYAQGARGNELPSLWLGPIGGFLVSEENHGSFYGDGELRDRAFAACLDQIEHEPFDDEGWNLLR